MKEREEPEPRDGAQENQLVHHVAGPVGATNLMTNGRRGEPRKRGRAYEREKPTIYL